MDNEKENLLSVVFVEKEEEEKEVEDEEKTDEQRGTGRLS